MNDVAELRADMSDFIQSRMRSDKEFTIRDICEACDLSFEKRVDVQRVYAVILNWRNTAQSLFDALDSDTMLKEHGTVEAVWGAFLKKLNARNVFLLFSMRNDDGKSVYYQPNWFDKEMIDFIRMRKQLHGQITILLEMDGYHEQFPPVSGLQTTPKELLLLMKHFLDKVEFQLGLEIREKIDQLETDEPKELLTITK